MAWFRCDSGKSKPFVIPQLVLQGGGFINGASTSKLQFNVESYKTLNIQSYSTGHGTISIWGDGTQIGVPVGTDVDISAYSLIELRWTFSATSQVSTVSAVFNNVVFS
mgnify:CR=1 FL=1